MARVKGGLASRRRKKALFKRTKGFWGAKKNILRKATEARLKADQYAFRDRRQKKRVFRSLWIVRINAAARAEGMTYGQFMSGLRRARVDVNRKMLAEIALSHPKEFAQLVQTAKSNQVK